MLLLHLADVTAHTQQQQQQQQIKPIENYQPSNYARLCMAGFSSALKLEKPQHAFTCTAQTHNVDHLKRTNRTHKAEQAKVTVAWV
jgi:hypothetical protein